MYVAPSGVHPGAAVVFVFLTWKATGSDVTLTALAAADGAQATTAARRAAHATRMIASRERC